MLRTTRTAGCMYGCMELASRIAVNTTLAAAAGGLTSLSCATLLGHPGDISPILNGILAGELRFQTCLSSQLHAYPAVYVCVPSYIASLDLAILQCMTCDVRISISLLDIL